MGIKGDVLLDEPIPDLICGLCQGNGQRALCFNIKKYTNCRLALKIY